MLEEEVKRLRILEGKESKKDQGSLTQMRWMLLLEGIQVEGIDVRIIINSKDKIPMILQNLMSLWENPKND
jgi:hypothetical protein